MEFYKHTYDNKLRLITAPLKGTNAVTVLVLVGTGSKYETKDINGISHFLEHMMFKGTEKRPVPLDISRTMDSMGAVYNAFTGHEYTGYFGKASKEKLDDVMDIISDIFINSKFPESEIEKERFVVTEEINMYQDNPTRDIQDKWTDLLYGDQPAGWNIAGTGKIVQGFKRDQFVDYFNTHYFAGNTIIAVAGDVDHEEIKAKVADYFTGVREQKDLTKEIVDDTQSEPGVLVVNKKTDQTHFLLGTRAYEVGHPKLPALKLVSIILGGGMSSRLFTEVRDKRGLAYAIFTSADQFTDHGFLGTYAGANNEKAMEAIQVITDEYRKMKAEPVPEDELRRVKDMIKGRLAISLEQSDEVAGYFAEQELLENKILTPGAKIRENRSSNNTRHSGSC
jgi:predicted Zn-dependent peptidase